MGLWHGSSPIAFPLSPAEQAEEFFARAKAAEKRGEMQVAELCYKLVIRAKPDHPGLIERLRDQNREKSDNKVLLGKEAETKGDLADANLLYFEALQMTPNHPEALSLTNALKDKMGAGFQSGSELAVQVKLRRIIIPVINFTDNSLGEAVDFLRTRTYELDETEGDPSKRGVKFVIGKPRIGGGDSGQLRIRDLRLRNVPLAVALKYICDQTKMSYSVEGGALILRAGEDLPGNQAPPPADPPSGDPFAPPVWKSKDGRSVEGMFVGLDGEAVVIKRDGKEFTIPFTRLNAESVALAKRMDDLKTKP